MWGQGGNYKIRWFCGRMPRQMAIVERKLESQPKLASEILDVNGFGGLYGRLLIASQVRESEVSITINPEMTTIVHLSGIKVDSTRNYNPITQKLSSDERTKAWQGVEFDIAYKDWRKKFTDKIKDLTDNDQLWAIQGFFGKEIKDFSETDTDTLYQTYCKDGKSDVNAFTNHITSNFKETDEKINPERLKIATPHLEKLASWLFGKETAVAVSKIIELETEIVNNPKNVVEKIFADKDRVNNLTETETEILNNLYHGLDAKKTEPDIAISELQGEETEPRELETINFSDYIDHTVQYMGTKHTIKDVKDNRVHLISESGNTQTMSKEELREKLRTSWKIFDASGSPVTFKIKEAGDEDEEEFVPAPINLNREEIPLGTQ